MNSNSFHIFSKTSSSQKSQKIEHVDFSSVSCCNDVDRLLAFNTANPVECEDVLRALTVLASQATNRLKFINLETIAKVFKAIGTHIGKFAVVEWGLRALTQFAHDKQAANKIIQYEGCQVLTIVLRRYYNKDIVVEEACRSIYHLTEFSQTCKQLFLDAGIVEVIAVNILADPSCVLHPSSLEWCLRAIGGLARRHPQAKIDFANCGVCESIVPIAKNVPITNKPFAEAACWVIGNLSYPDVDNQTRLCACGSAEYLASVLIQHLESGLLIQEVFRGIRNLCYQHEENCARLVDADICIALVHVITFHIHKGIEIGAVKETLSEKVESTLKSSMIPSYISSSIVSSASATISSLSKGTTMIGISAGITTARVSSSGSGSVAVVTEADLEATATRGAVQWGWYAVAGLAQNRNAVKTFLTTNVIKVMKTSLERYGVLEGAAQWTCHAASNLARDPECAVLLGHPQQGILQELCNILRLHIDDAEVTEECLSAIGVLCMIEENKEAFAALGLEAILIRAITRHVAVEEVAEQGCFVIAKLCDSPRVENGAGGSCESSSGSNQMMMANLAAAGACKLLPTLMIKYHDNLRIAEHCCHALALLASSEAISRKLGSASASAAVIAVMESHLSDTHILALALRSIVQLNESESAGNLSNLRNDGVCAAVVKGLLANVDGSPEIVKLSLDVITALAADESCKLKFLQEATLGDALVKSLSLAVADKDIVLAGLSAVSSLCGGVVDMNKERVATVASGFSPAVSSDDLLASKPTELRGDGSGSNSIVSDSSLLLNAKLCESGVCEAVITIFIRHKDQHDVCISACSAISSLAEFAENRRKMFPSYETLLEVASNNKELAAVVRSVCLAIGSVAKDDSSGRSQEILSSLGVCELLVGLLTKYADSSDLCASICRAITSVVYLHQGNKMKLLQIDCMKLLQNSLIRHMDTEESTRYAVCAIAELIIDNSSDDILTHESSETCALVVHAMRRYLASSKLVQAGCMAIVALKHMNRFLGQASACELVVTVLIRYASSEAVVQWALRAIGSLATTADNRLAFKETNLCDTICMSLHTHVGSESLLSVMLMRQTSSVHVARYGCDAIYHLSRHQIDAAYFQTKFTQSNACEIVAKIFLKYSVIDAVATACLRAVVVLTKGSVGNAVKFGSLGVCSSIVECLRNFQSSSDVAKWGCRCISVLAEDNQSNISKFISSGVCESIPAAMQGHQMNVGVAGAGADAIAAIVGSAGGDMSFASRFGRSGACEALVSAIRNHKTQPVVVERACHATAALAKLHGNAGWFGASGCLEALLVSQNVHVDNHFVQGAAWLALANLCIDENNRVKLVSSGACERVVEALERHIEDRTLVHSAALAVERLSELKDEPFRGVMRLETINTGDSVANEVSDKRSSSKMLAEDAVLTEDSQVTEGLKVTPRSQMYPERALLDDNHQADNVEDLEEEEFASDSGVLSQCNSDSKLSSLVPATVETSYEEISLDNTDAVVNKSPVVPALSVEIMTDTVIEESSKLEYNDNDGGEEVSSVMFMSPRTVVSQSTVCPNDTEVFVYMRSPDTAKGKFFTARCHDSLVHALDRHCTDEKTASQLCRTIARLCQGHGGAKQPERVAFGRAGGPTELVRVLQEHPNSELVTRWACNALSEAIRENKRNKMAVRNQGACELLVQALRKHRHSASGHITVESACIAIYHLCLHNSSTKQIFGKAGAVEGLLETMELHQRTLESVYACCIALYQVCLGNMSNINSLNVSGAAAILSGVLQKHIDVKNLATAAVSTLVLMSCSKNLAGQQNLSLAGIYKQIPSLFLRYEKLDSLSTSLCATITLLTYRNAKNKTHLGQTGLLKGVFQITEKLIGIIWDDLQSKSRKKLPSPTLTLQSVVARSEAALSGRSDSSAIVADSETGENTSSVPQLDLFSPSFIHPSITGIVLHKSEYDHTERMQTNAAAVLLEESLRALGNLIIDHDVNKGKILAAHPNILEILRPVAFYNSGMLSMTNDDGASTERQHLAIIRIAKLVHIIFLQLTIHM